MANGQSPLGAFLAGQQGALNIRQQRQQLAAQDVAREREQFGFQINQAQLLNNALGALERLPQEQRFGVAQQMRPELQQLGIELPEFGPEHLSDQAIQGHKAALTGFIQNPQEATARFQRGQGAIVETEGGRAFAAEVFDPRTGQVRTELAPIGQQLTSKLGETPEQITERKVQEAGRRTTAIETAKQQAEKDKAIEEGQKTFRVFSLALDNLSQSLGATSLSGPVAGRIPATTSASQIADAAKAIMLPTLKQIFRQAGEGVFTDKDQEALEAMLPRRQQTREAQMANIDAIEIIVRAKLGLDLPTTQTAQAEGPSLGAAGDTPEGTTATNQQTNQRIVVRNGQWVPL